MKKTLLKQFVFGLSLMISATAGMFAQSAGGTIRGSIVDPSGALIPSAQVTISNADGFSRTLNTNEVGTFEISQLDPGKYTLSIDATGFTSALEGEVKVADGKVIEENIKLGISVNQEVDVFANE